MPRLLFTLALLSTCYLLRVSAPADEPVVAVAASARYINNRPLETVGEASLAYRSDSTIAASTSTLGPHLVVPATDTATDAATATQSPDNR